MLLIWCPAHCRLLLFELPDCISEIDLEEKRQLEEERALAELRSGEAAAVSVSELLQKLSRPDEHILYYTGGIQLLTEMIQDCELPPLAL